MAKPLRDDEIVEAIGKKALIGAGYSEATIKKWKARYRGIPWRARARVAALAADRNVKLPADFLYVQRRAA